MWGVVRSLVTRLLHIFSWFWLWNNFVNRLLFGKVKTYSTISNYRCTYVFRTCVFHPCESYLHFQYLHFPSLQNVLFRTCIFRTYIFQYLRFQRPLTELWNVVRHLVYTEGVLSYYGFSNLDAMRLWWWWRWRWRWRRYGFFYRTICRPHDCLLIMSSMHICLRRPSQINSGFSWWRPGGPPAAGREGGCRSIMRPTPWIKRGGGR